MKNLNKIILIRDRLNKKLEKITGISYYGNNGSYGIWKKPQQ